MKLALIALVFSSTALAQDCFVRTTEISTREVSLAREICVESINLKLDIFSVSKAEVNLTIDGVSAQTLVNLQNGRTLSTGEKAFTVVLDKSESGGWCGDTWLAATTGALAVKADGSAARVMDVKGEINFSGDNCHSGFQTIQRLSFEQR
jgi:hypothetical protein